MVSNRLSSEEIKIVYLDLTDSYGFYRSRPGKQPFICLSESLLEESQKPLHLNVYRVLLDYHRELPSGSSYKLFPMLRYYEQLVPPEALPMTEPGLEYVGRAMRRWKFMQYDESRVIGKAAG